MSDVLEIYLEGTDRLIAVVNTSMIPPDGSIISIRKENWKVIYSTFAIDNYDISAERKMRCNTWVEKHER